MHHVLSSSAFALAISVRDGGVSLADSTRAATRSDAGEAATTGSLSSAAFVRFLAGFELGVKLSSGSATLFASAMARTMSSCRPSLATTLAYGVTFFCFPFTTTVYSIGLHANRSRTVPYSGCPGFCSFLSAVDWQVLQNDWSVVGALVHCVKRS